MGNIIWTWIFLGHRLLWKSQSNDRSQYMIFFTHFKLNNNIQQSWTVLFFQFEDANIYMNTIFKFTASSIVVIIFFV